MTIVNGTAIKVCFNQLVAFLGFWCLLGTSSEPFIAKSPNAAAITRQRMSTAMDGFDRFARSQSPDDLKSSSRALLYSLWFNGMDAKDAMELRRTYVHDYILLMQGIVSLEDPAYGRGGLNYVVFVCVAPPAEPDGRTLFPCADPNLITDAATRNEYVRRIEENHQNELRRAKQIRLQMVENEIATAFESILELLRTKAPSDHNALDAIVDSSGLSSDRQSRIRAWYK